MYMLVSILFTTLVTGYSYKIHGFLGDMLGIHLEKNHPSIYNKVIKDLNGTSLYEGSVWADRVKRTGKYYWTKKLHYININSCSATKDEIKAVCGTGCIYSFINDLVDKQLTGRLSREENIKFLLHSLQDINQPLHSYGKDRGGNGFEVIRNRNGRNKTYNLHGLWDDEIPSYYVENFHNKDRYVTEDDMTLTSVINFNLNLSCEYIYDIVDNYIIFEKYFNPLMVRVLFDNYISLSVSVLKKYYETSEEL